MAEMITKVRIENEQKTNGMYINNTKFYCDENTSDYSNNNDMN